MSTRNHLGILGIISALFNGLVATPEAGSAIVYSPGPLPPPPPLVIGSPQAIDFDGNGVVETVFSTGFVICTADVPTSFCDWPFFIGATGSNQILVSGYYSAVQSLGELLGDVAPTNATWSSPGFEGYLTDQWWSHYGREINGQLVYQGWGGPLGSAGVGYLGVRLYSSDGFHYGWVRVQAGFPGLVVDWAYQTQPDTPIRAGDIGTESDSDQFKVEFHEVSRKDRGLDRLSGSGSLILTDSKLRCELHLTGNSSTAEIQGTANPRSHGNVKPVWSFPAPLVRGTNHTAFFGETTLTHAQLRQLARGQLYICIDGCEVMGRILPVEETRKRRQ